MAKKLKRPREIRSIKKARLEIERQLEELILTRAALRHLLYFLDDLRLDYRRRFAIEEQIWLAPRIKRLDEIRKLAGL